MIYGQAVLVNVAATILRLLVGFAASARRELKEQETQQRTGEAESAVVASSEPASTPSPSELHEATLEWLADHPGLLSPYEGEWVAVADRQIIAHNPSAVEVMRVAMERGFDRPLLIPVMPADFIGG